jgi:hypothetical protein
MCVAGAGSDRLLKQVSGLGVHHVAKDLKKTNP